MVVEITGHAIPADSKLESEREVTISHHFETIFRTITHVEAAMVISKSTDNQAKSLIAEVVEAMNGDGFTIDWSPLVTNF